jgi:hypothetical protein
MTMKILKNTLNAEELRKEKMFSITRYLDACHKKGEQPSADVMEHVDFSEVGSKHLISYTKEHGQYNDHIEQTIAENCITYLPFEAYEKFITADWITFTGRHEISLTRKALARKNISLLERFHDLGVKKALDDKEFTHTYTRDYIQQVYLIGTHLKDNYSSVPEDFNERFLKLVKKCVCEHDYFGKLDFVKHKNAKLVYKKNPNWIKDCAWFSKDHGGGLEKSFNDLLKSLVSSDKYMLLLEDGLIHIAKNYPKEIKYILGFEHNPKPSIKNDDKLLDNILSAAFRKGNLAAAKLLIETFGLSERECFSAYRENVIEDINRVKEKYSDKAPLDSLLTNNFTDTYQKAKKEFFPTLNTDYLPLFLLGQDQILKNELLSNSKKVINVKMPFGRESFSLYDSILLAKAVDTVTKHLEKEGKKLEFSLEKDDCLGMQIKDVVAKHIYYNEKSLLNEVDYNNIPTENWNNLFKNQSIASFLKVHHKKKVSEIEIDDLKVLWNKAMLETVLSNDNVEKTKRMKL